MVPGGITGGRHGNALDAFVDRERTDQPAISDVIIKSHRITVVFQLAGTNEAGPQAVARHRGSWRACAGRSPSAPAALLGPGPFVQAPFHAASPRCRVGWHGRPAAGQAAAPCRVRRRARWRARRTKHQRLRLFGTRTLSWGKGPARCIARRHSLLPRSHLAGCECATQHQPPSWFPSEAICHSRQRRSQALSEPQSRIHLPWCSAHRARPEGRALRVAANASS